MNSPKKSLTVFKLVMMAVIAIDSLKNLPSNAQYGTSLLFYYLIGILIFFIPSALVSAELATSLPETGGAYVWIREAFGKRCAFMAVWIQWLITVTWAPTILSFTVGMLFYFCSPSTAENKILMLAAILILFWLALFFISRGMQVSSRISSLSALVGVILPMFFITLLGVIWLMEGHASQIHFSFHSMNNHLVSMDHLRLFIPLLYSLMGIEMIAAHAGDVQNPQVNYPRALIIASLLIFATMIPSSLALAIVIPPEQIGLTTGVAAGFGNFLHAFHLSHLFPFIIGAIALGSFGVFYNGLFIVARYLLIVAKDESLPPFLSKTNKHNMPVMQLFLQGLVFTIMTSVFILMPSVNSAFWLLTASCAQFGLIYYIILFAAAVVLRYKQPHLHRPFRIGKGPALITSLCTIAILTCIVSIGFGFIPPQDVLAHDIVWYETCLVAFMVGGITIGLLIYERNRVTSSPIICNNPL